MHFLLVYMTVFSTALLISLKAHNDTKTGVYQAFMAALPILVGRVVYVSTQALLPNQQFGLVFVSVFISVFVSVAALAVDYERNSKSTE